MEIHGYQSRINHARSRKYKIVWVSILVVLLAAVLTVALTLYFLSIRTASFLGVIDKIEYTIEDCTVGISGRCDHKDILERVLTRVSKVVKLRRPISFRLKFVPVCGQADQSANAVQCVPEKSKILGLGSKFNLLELTCADRSIDYAEVCQNAQPCDFKVGAEKNSMFFVQSALAKQLVVQDISKYEFNMLNSTDDIAIYHDKDLKFWWRGENRAIKYDEIDLEYLYLKIFVSKLGIGSTIGWNAYKSAYLVPSIMFPSIWDSHVLGKRSQRIVGDAFHQIVQRFFDVDDTPEFSAKEELFEYILANDEARIVSQSLYQEATQERSFVFRTLPQTSGGSSQDIGLNTFKGTFLPGQSWSYLGEPNDETRYLLSPTTTAGKELFEAQQSTYLDSGIDLSTARILNTMGYNVSGLHSWEGECWKPQKP